MESATPKALQQMDLRGVEAPGHILRVLEQVAKLPAGTALQARLDNNPWQLYDLLQQRGFVLTGERTADGGFLATVRERERASSR